MSLLFRRRLHLMLLPMLIGAALMLENAASAREYPVIAQAERAGFQPWIFRDDPEFPLRVWLRKASDASGQDRSTLIVIESDGAPWRFGGRVPPDDPTPHAPIGLRMAMAAPTSMAVAYFARPCQFMRVSKLGHSPCADPQWWTSKRFAPQVVEAYVARILGLLTFEARAAGQSPRPASDRELFPSTASPPLVRPLPEHPQLILSGFSGGGTLALRIAAQWRRYLPEASALCLISLAAPLDLSAWTAHHRMSSLHEFAHTREDPMALAEDLVGIRAHFAFGEADRRVPLQSAGYFALHSTWQSKLHQYPGLAHTDDWLLIWPTLLQRAC